MSGVPQGHSTTNGHMNGPEDLEKATKSMTHEEKTAALHAAKFGYGPLSHIRSDDARAALPGEHLYFQDILQLLTLPSVRW
jgi:hypothetical protein